MKKIFLLFVFIFTSLLYSQSFSGPESVEWDSTYNRWLISNTTSHAILARTQSGTLSTFVSTTTNGPHGIEILNGVLYACCSGRIKGYNLATGTEVFNLNLGASFLNGLTTDGDSVLYATDFTNKDIFRINPSTNQFYVMSSNTVTTPNGIIYDGANNRCIFVNWGSNAPIKAISLTSPYTISTLTTTTLSNCDGITIDHLGYYYVTSWGNNRMNRFANDFTGGFTVMNSFVLNSPADIDCKFDAIDTVGVPNSGNNTCTFIPLAPPTSAYTATDTVVCLGDFVIYTNTSTNADSFSWLFGGGNPGSGTTSPSTVTYDTLGLYSTALTTTNVYGTTSISHSIQVVAGPAPSITAAGNDFSTTTTFITYQWYHDGILISGATSQTYTVTSGGEYYCVVTDNSGCSGTSNIITSTLGIEDNFSENIKLYPNPASEVLMIEFALPAPQDIHYSIVDLQGRIIKTYSGSFEAKGLNYLSIDLDGISNGSYILKLYSENIAVNKKFILNR